MLLSVPAQRRNTEALRARRRVELSAKLLAAIERLYDQGEPYSDVSVERLIREAGVTRSTFYSYYADKDALLGELALTVLDGLVAFWSRLSPSLTRGELEDAISQILTAYIPHRAVMVAICNPVPSRDARAVFETMFMERSAKKVARFIKAGQDQGHIDPELDADTTAALLMWMTERGLDKLVARAEPQRVQALARSLTDIFWRTLFLGVAR
jgi:TetR/AcrR family transcriptional regulator, ethionamide resistance regulator